VILHDFKEATTFHQLPPAISLANIYTYEANPSLRLMLFVNPFFTGLYRAEITTGNLSQDNIPIRSVPFIGFVKWSEGSGRSLHHRQRHVR